MIKVTPKWWVKGKQPHLLTLATTRNRQNNDPSKNQRQFAETEMDEAPSDPFLGGIQCNNLPTPMVPPPTAKATRQRCQLGREMHRQAQHLAALRFSDKCPEWVPGLNLKLKGKVATPNQLATQICGIANSGAWKAKHLANRRTLFGRDQRMQEETHRWRTLSPTILKAALLHTSCRASRANKQVRIF